MKRVPPFLVFSPDELLGVELRLIEAEQAGVPLPEEVPTDELALRILLVSGLWPRGDVRPTA